MRGIIETMLTQKGNEYNGGAIKLAKYPFYSWPATQRSTMSATLYSLLWFVDFKS